MPSKLMQATIAAASITLLAGCEHSKSLDLDERGQIDADVYVLIKQDPANAGDYIFTYSGSDSFVDEDGNLDFRFGEARRKAVKIDFSIHPDSISGIRFKSPGREAMYIALEEAVGPNGSPSEKYPETLDEFKGFATKQGGIAFHVIDKNADGKVYRYAMRFELDGELVVHDPTVKNGKIR